MRPVPRQASRSQEETLNTTLSLPSCQNGDFTAALLREGEVTDETQVPAANSQGTVEKAV